MFENGKLKGEIYKLLSKNTLKVIYLKMVKWFVFVKISNNILVLFENGKLKGEIYKLLSKNTLKVIY